VAASSGVTSFRKTEAGAEEDESVKFGNTERALKGTTAFRGASRPVKDLAQVLRITGSSALPEAVAHKGMPSLASLPVRLEGATGVGVLNAPTGEIVPRRVAGAQCVISDTFGQFSGTTATSPATKGYVSKSNIGNKPLSLTKRVFAFSAPVIPTGIPQISENPQIAASSLLS